MQKWTSIMPLLIHLNLHSPNNVNDSCKGANHKKCPSKIEGTPHIYTYKVN